MRSLWRTCSLLAGGTLVVACGDPELKTDLDTEGPPEVNMVTVTNEGAPVFVNGGPFFEAPTFCRDTGGRVNREICPADEASGGRAVTARADVNPVGWQVRVVFSELVDPDVEELVTADGVTTGTIANTNPVVLDCGGGALAIDGHYDPSGNDVTAPPGPSIVAFSTDGGGFPSSTGSACTVTVANSVTDKDNNAIPAAEAGPYDFSIANLHLVGSEPAPAFDMAGTLIEVDDVAPVDENGADLPLVIEFNAPIDMASLDAADLTLTLGDMTAVAVTVTSTGTGIEIVPTAGWLGETSYILTLTAASTISDASASGGVYDAPAADYVVLFNTDALPAAVDAGPDAT